MTRISSVFMMLAFFAGSNEVFADEPMPGMVQSRSNQGEEATAAGENPKVDQGHPSFALSAKQLALWQGDSQPAQPAKADVPFALPPVPVNLDRNKASPTPEMPPIPSGPVETAPAGSASPVPASPLEPLPAQGPNPLPADDKLAPVKDNGPPAPFNIMDSTRVTELTVTRGRSQLVRSKVEFIAPPWSIPIYAISSNILPPRSDSSASASARPR